MKTLRGLKGRKDAGRFWYKLLYKILVNILGMVPCSTCKGLFSWRKDGHQALLCLATDDILFASTSPTLWDTLLITFHQYFEYTTQTGDELAFLNYRIIQSKHGVSIDQTNHIQQTILSIYFKDKQNVPFQSSPFPKDPKFEMDLFKALPMSDEDLDKMANKINGTYQFYVGAIQHVAGHSRHDLQYAIMRLSGYNANPNLQCFNALDQLLCYLYHHPHIPTMFPRKKVSHTTPLASHFGTGDAEITSLDYQHFTGHKSWSDSDFARDLTDRRSVISAIHEYNGVACAWHTNKQPDTAASTTDAEICSLFQTAKRTVSYRRLLLSIGRASPTATPIFEDNAATIAQVLRDRITPRTKHLDILITWLHEQYSRERFVPIRATSHNQRADHNSKPHGGITLQTKALPLFGFSNYPPPDSKHYTLLELHLYNIGMHRGSFLRSNKQSIDHQQGATLDTTL